jgi:DNA-directed RNA polymerase subunit M/transcription elongation factor TFIIS
MMDKLNLTHENLDLDAVMDIVVNCIDYIYDDEEIYYAKDSTKEELNEFVENMQQTDLEKIQKFFETMPKIKKTLQFKCPKCKYQDNIVVEGIQNFFV